MRFLVFGLLGGVLGFVLGIVATMAWASLSGAFSGEAGDGAGTFFSLFLVFAAPTGGAIGLVAGICYATYR